MAIQDLFIKQSSNPEDARVDMPSKYREVMAWNPKLGDIAPDFHAESTHGHVDFHDCAEGRWTALFSFPEDRGGISETEVVSLSVHAGELAERNAQVYGISPTTLGVNVNWRTQIERVFDVSVSVPLIADTRGVVCEAMGMRHPKALIEKTVRKIMIFDPALRLRWMAEYPSCVGRSIEELLRVLDALQMFDTHDLGTPMDWFPGDDVIVRPDINTKEAIARYGDRVRVITDQIRTVRLAD